MVSGNLDEARKNRERIEQMRKKEAEEDRKRASRHKGGFSNVVVAKKAAEKARNGKG
jgi:hypothetical protein